MILTVLKNTVLSNLVTNIVTYANFTVWNSSFHSCPILLCDISLETSWKDIYNCISLDSIEQNWNEKSETVEFVYVTIIATKFDNMVPRPCWPDIELAENKITIFIPGNIDLEDLPLSINAYIFLENHYTCKQFNFIINVGEKLSSKPWKVLCDWRTDRRMWRYYPCSADDIKILSSYIHLFIRWFYVECLHLSFNCAQVVCHPRILPPESIYSTILNHFITHRYIRPGMCVRLDSEKMYSKTILYIFEFRNIRTPFSE